MKIKNIYFLFLLLFQTVLFAQEEKSINKWELCIQFSPDFAHRTLSYHASDDLNSSIVKSRNSYEVADFRITTGISIRYRLSKLVSLETGIYYASKGFQTKWLDSFVPLQISDPLIPEKFKTRDRFHYLDIPIKAYFKIFEKNRLEFLFAPAIISSYLIEHEYTVFYQYSNRLEKKVLDKNEPFNDLNFSYSISSVLSLKFSNKVKFQIEPIFRKSINSIIDTPIKARLWSLGLNFGFYFNL